MVSYRMGCRCRLVIGCGGLLLVGIGVGLGLGMFGGLWGCGV